MAAHNRVARSRRSGSDRISRVFQFTSSRVYTRNVRLRSGPLVEGAQWMEDYGVFWIVTVRALEV